MISPLKPLTRFKHDPASGEEKTRAAQYRQGLSRGRSIRAGRPRGYRKTRQKLVTFFDFYGRIRVSDVNEVKLATDSTQLIENTKLFWESGL